MSSDKLIFQSGCAKFDSQVAVFEVDGQIITGWMDGMDNTHPVQWVALTYACLFVLGDTVHGLIMARQMFNGWCINR